MACCCRPRPAAAAGAVDRSTFSVRARAVQLPPTLVACARSSRRTAPRRQRQPSAASRAGWAARTSAYAHRATTPPRVGLYTHHRVCHRHQTVGTHRLGQHSLIGPRRSAISRRPRALLDHAIAAASMPTRADPAGSRGDRSSWPSARLRQQVHHHISSSRARTWQRAIARHQRLVDTTVRAMPARDSSASDWRHQRRLPPPIIFPSAPSIPASYIGAAKIVIAPSTGAPPVNAAHLA